MSVSSLLELLELHDPGWAEVLGYRREAVGSDSQILKYVELAPRTKNMEWNQAARAYLLAERLMYTSSLMELWDPPGETAKKRQLKFLETASKTKIFDRIRQVMLEQVDTRDIEGAVTLRLRDSSRKAWAPKYFTKPKQSYPNYFRYLITGLRTTMVMLTAEEAARYLRENKQDYTTRISDEKARFDPTRFVLGERSGGLSEVISCSIISTTKCKTYMDMCFGLVLEVPERNILRAEARDIETSGVQKAARARHDQGLSKYKRLIAEKNYWDLLGGQCQKTLSSPEKILKATHGHNEVVVLRDGPDGGKVKVSAVFVKTRHGKLWQDFFGKEGRIAAVVLREVKGHLPIVAVEDASRQASNVGFTDWLSGDTSPLGVVGSGQTCSHCKRVHGWTPSLLRRWHQCSVCRAVFCWSCGWKLRYYSGASLDEVLDMMHEDYLNPGVRACMYCRGRTRLV